ncbi:reticulon-4a isoform X1 [Cololabis saira]|uniref:reticulon-4a isoform X1 n=1 Tax=Cololabis saira TaxID=129043 RepID=UPI002AD54CCC|nr:reticulon-4a isoform X1 [Cololabis saira]
MSEVKRNPFEFQGSESPTPDLVQYGTTAGPQEGVPPALEPEPLSKAAAPTAFKDEEDEEDAVLPPSLPDILKSSPLNPDKLDSGSSEGSPEQSPVFERRMMESPNPPINLSANNPFAFEAKVSLLKEMTEQMEAERDSDQVRVQDQDQNLGTFDLVKEAEPVPVPAAPARVEQQDWFSGRGDAPPPHRAAPEPFEPLDFLEKKKNPTVVEDSDSESPTADSLSPVLEAMAKNPASFQVEAELKGAELKQEEVEPEEEVSEHEVSSEEFEFIERPPRGVIDDFLEALDTSKFAAAAPPEIPLDDDELGFEAKETTPTKELATPPKDLATPPKEAEPEEDWASYRLLTQAPPPQKSKAELETPEATPPASKVAPPTTSQVATPPTLAGQSEQPTAPTSSRKGFTMPNVNLRKVVELLYWRDVKTTGVVFGAALLLLLSLTLCSIVSVCSYVGLALLSVTICFRIYKGILQAVQKSDEGHPFRQYLDQEVALSEDTVHKYSDLVLAKLNKTICEMRRLFLVEDLVDSIKFAVLMWILTYIGALFNGLTLLILGLVAVFSCPIVYEKHQTQIDHYVGMVNNQVKDVIGKIQAKVPGMKRKAE